MTTRYEQAASGHFAGPGISGDPAGGAGAAHVDRSVVRQALSRALRGEATDKPSRKLEAVRRAAQYDYPSGDIDQMLAEIEADAPGSAPLN